MVVLVTLTSRTEVCPECGREFPAVPSVPSILAPNPPSAQSCLNCSSPLQYALGRERKIDLGDKPLRIVVTDREDSWMANAYPARSSAVDTWVFAAVWAAAMYFIWSHELKGWSVINLCLTVLMPLLFLKAAFQTWGRYVVAGSADTVRVFSGIGKFSVSRSFTLKSLSEIRLRTQHGRRGSTRKRIVVKAERTFCFGEELSDAQRQYLALLLLSKRHSSVGQ